MFAPIEQHPLASLINEYTSILLFAGLEIENLSDFYLNRKNPTTLALQGDKNNESQNNFFQFLAQDFSRWSVKQCEILIEMLKNDLLRKGAQSAYVRVYCKKMEDISSKTKYKQLKDKAIEQFNKLSRNEQIQYLAYYLHEGMHIFNTTDGAQRSSKLLHSHIGQIHNMGNQRQRVIENGMSLEGINLSFLSGFNSNELINREYERQTLNFGQNQPNKSQGKQGTNLQYNQGDSRNRNDIYKLALGNRVSQKPQKQNSKSDESKQKEEFQTLKSLFKKLQNNV